MKRAVLFDLFGTLVPSQPLDSYRGMVDAVAETLDVPIDDFFPEWMKVNDGRLSGKFGSSETEIEVVASVFGVTPSADQMAKCVEVRRETVLSWLTPKPGALEALEKLRSDGVQVALVSDCVFDVPATWHRSPLSAKFNTTVFSCEMKVRKPDRRMYEAALTELQLEPAQAVFVGDGGSGELDGAKDVGIDAYLLDESGIDTNVLRVDVKAWDGPRISSLSEVPGLVR